MSYGFKSLTIHKKLRIDKRKGTDSWYARLTLPNGKRVVKSTKTENLEDAKEMRKLLDQEKKQKEAEEEQMTYLIAGLAIVGVLVAVFIGVNEISEMCAKSRCGR